MDENRRIGEAEAQEAKSAKKIEEEKTARRRFFYLLIGVACVFAALIAWEIVGLFL